MFEKTYLKRGSIIQDMNFWTKCLCFLVFIPISAFIAPTSILILISLYIVSLIELSRINLLMFWKQVRVYYIFLTISLVLLSLFFSPGDLSSRTILGLIMSVRFSVLIGIGTLFSLVTDAIEIPIGLMRARVPHRYGVTIMVAFRMLPLISNKVNNIIEVQRIRGLKFSFSLLGIPRLFMQLMSLLIPIVYSTLETSVGLSDTLIARGYNPNAPSITLPPSHINRWDILITLLTGVFLVLAFFPL